MKYQQIFPQARLSKWIRYFWILENDTDEQSSQVLKPLADGCPGIIFQHSSAGTFHDQVKNLLPEVFLYGQTTRPIDLQLEGRFKTVGVCFDPLGLKSLFRFHASELTDSCIDLTLLMNHLRDRLLNSASVKGQIQILSSSILDLVKANEPSMDPAAEFAVRRIVESHGNIQLSSLQRDLQFSERALQRKFEQHVGIPPKLFARICRFQATVTQLKHNGSDNLSDIAYDHGYSDQSHFIRTFKEFAGLSPLQFRKTISKVTSNFTVS
jgi:AraC-like DNA-binding protein